MDKSFSIPIELGDKTVNFSLVFDPACFTKYRFVSLDDGKSPGIPASLFSIALYKACVRLTHENTRLKKMLEKKSA